MGEAFESAWSLLKAITDEDFIDNGAFRLVYNHGPNEVVKIPTDYYGRPEYYSSAAINNAMSQLGLPFATETPQIVTGEDGKPTVGYTQRKFPRTFGRARDNEVGEWRDFLYDALRNGKFNLDLDDYNELKQQGISVIGDEYREKFDDLLRTMGGIDKFGESTNPLIQALRIADFHEGNIGSDEEGNLSFIDFSPYIEDEKGTNTLRGIKGGGMGKDLPYRFSKIPKEQRESFTNLFGDRSFFDGVRNRLHELDSAELRNHDKQFNDYLAKVKQIREANAIANDPYQQSLYQSVADAIDNRPYLVDTGADNLDGGKEDDYYDLGVVDRNKRRLITEGPFTEDYL